MLPLTRTSLSLKENLRAKEGGKEQTGETRFASLLYPSHGPLRFVTSHSRFALASMRNHAKNEAPEDGAGRLDKTLPTLSKTFQNFGFFYDVNQTATVASTVFVKNKGGNNEEKLQK